MNQITNEVFTQGKQILAEKKIQLNLIVAQNKSGAIGTGDAMPWHISEDLKFFKKETIGAQLIMGRKTYDSIGKALPGRRTIVLSKNTTEIHSVQIANSAIQALQLLEPNRSTFIAGGSLIYRLFEPWVQRACITLVDQEVVNAITMYDGFMRLQKQGFKQQQTIRLTDDALVYILSRPENI